MDEISSHNQPHSELDPPTHEWWVGAIPDDPPGETDRPTTWHYVPVLCRNLAAGVKHVWKTLVPDWYEHFPESPTQQHPWLWNKFVRYFDVRHVKQWRAYWSGAGELTYTILLKFDDIDQVKHGRAIHFVPTPSAVNKVTFGATWNGETGDAEGGFQVSGGGQVNFATFAVLADGTFYMQKDQIVETNGKRYWKVSVSGVNYGIEMTQLP